MKRRALLGAAALGALGACSRSKFFKLAWDEEAKLHDGRVIVVNLKFTYERLDVFSEYERAILRDTEMTFDSGSPLGRVSQMFRRMRPLSLDQRAGTWYTVIEARGAGDSPTISGQDWGPSQTREGRRTTKLVATGFVPIPIAEFPNELVEFNLLREHDPLEEVSRFNGRLVDLEIKAAYNALHPNHPADVRLAKPLHAQPN